MRRSPHLADRPGAFQGCQAAEKGTIPDSPDPTEGMRCSCRILDVKGPGRRPFFFFVRDEFKPLVHARAAVSLSQCASLAPAAHPMAGMNTVAHEHFIC